MSNEEQLQRFHPWDPAMLIVGMLVLGMALWGTFAAPVRADGARLWRRRFAMASAALAILALGFAGTCAWRAYGVWRSPGGTPKEFALKAIPALEYSAIGFLGLLALGAAYYLVATAPARGRPLTLAGVVLLSAPFLPSLLVPPREDRGGFFPIPPLPGSIGPLSTGLLCGMLVLGIASLWALCLMVRRAGSQGRTDLGRHLGTWAGLGAAVFAVVSLHLMCMEVLFLRAMLGPRAGPLREDLIRSASGNWVLVAALLVGTGAAAIAGLRRGGAEEPTP